MMFCLGSFFVLSFFHLFRLCSCHIPSMFVLWSFFILSLLCQHFVMFHSSSGYVLSKLSFRPCLNDTTPPHINIFHLFELCPYIDNVYRDQRRDREIAKLLITVVLVFIACHSFRMVLNVYEVFHLAYYGDIQDQWPAWFKSSSSSNSCSLSNTHASVSCTDMTERLNT